MYENYQNGMYQPNQMPNYNGQKKSSGAGKVVALALCCSLVGGAFGAGGTYVLTKAASAIRGEAAPTSVYESSREPAALNVLHVDGGTELTPAEVYAANVNSTVGITTSISTNFFGYRTTSAASGSGFVLSSDGYIVTNYHVIEDGSSVTVATYDGKTYPATVVGYDAENDVAVLKIDADGLTPVVLGSSEDSKVGDSVVAIGNPLGELTFSLTGGVISALDRSITVDGRSMDLIQTDCAINSGNSGGALFNMYGEVIGITNAKLSSGSSGASIDNIGFAIPIDRVKDLIEGIITDGTVDKPYIGVTISALGSEYQRFGLSGVVVQSVEKDSPAEKAGLKEDDIITAANGEPVDENSDLTSAVSKCSEGDSLKLSVTRQGEELEITVTVGIKTQSALADDEDKGDENSVQQDPFGFLPWSNGFGSDSGIDM